MKAVRNYDADDLGEDLKKKFYVTIETDDDVLEYVSFDNEEEAISYIKFFNGFIQHCNSRIYLPL